MSYIKLDRKLLEWEWASDPDVLAIWIRILLEANFKKGKHKGKVFEEGTFPTSISLLSEKSGLSVKKVRNCLKKLQKTGEIEVESTKHGTKIRVVKWSEYQTEGKQKGKQRANKGQTKGNSIRREEYKKERNIYNSVPFYDSSLNTRMSEDEERQLMSLMRGEA